MKRRRHHATRFFRKENTTFTNQQLFISGSLSRGHRTPSLETTIALCNALHASVDYVVSDDISTRDDEIMTDIRAQLVKLTPDEKQYFYHMIVGYIQLKGENAATKTLLAAKKEL